jgi:hypothetical protein
MDEKYVLNWLVIKFSKAQRGGAFCLYFGYKETLYMTFGHCQCHLLHNIWIRNEGVITFKVRDLEVGKNVQQTHYPLSLSNFHHIIK